MTIYNGNPNRVAVKTTDCAAGINSKSFTYAGAKHNPETWLISRTSPLKVYVFFLFFCDVFRWNILRKARESRVAETRHGDWSRSSFHGVAWL